MRRKRWLIGLVCATVLLAAGLGIVRYVCRPKVLYQVTILPVLGGVEMRPFGINDAGQVVGAVRNEDGTTRVVLWDKKGGAREVASFAKGCEMVAFALNNAGQIAGTVTDPNHAFSSSFWDTDGRQYRLEASAGGQCQIGALNNRGQVVGHWTAARGPRHAFLWDKTAGLRDLGTFGGLESLACGVNDRGQIVGFFSTFQSQWRAFLCDPNLGLRDLGPTDFGPAATCRINNQGFIVGLFGSPDDQACVSTWTLAAGAQQLPSFGTWAEVAALNNANQFVTNVQQRQFHVGGHRFGGRVDSYFWKSGIDTTQVCDHLGRSDARALTVVGLNKDGVMVGSLTVTGLPYRQAVLLEPIP